MSAPDLIARLLLSTGRDQDLDHEIALASGAYMFEQRDKDSKPWYYRTVDEGHPLYHRRSVPPEYSQCMADIAALKARAAA